MQMNNTYADILIYEDEEYVSFETTVDRFLKPLIISRPTDKELIYMVFGGESGIIYLYSYNPRLRKFTKLNDYSLKNEEN